MEDKIIEIIIQVSTTIGGLSAIGIFIKRLFDSFDAKINKLDENQCKNYLVNYLGSIENDVNKSLEQTLRAHEIYDRYTKELGKNSYIHEKWEKLKKEEKI